MLLELHPGNENYYYSKQGLNFINRCEFYSDASAGFNIEQDFEKRLMNPLPFMHKINMRRFWNIKVVWAILPMPTAN